MFNPFSCLKEETEEEERATTEDVTPPDPIRSAAAANAAFADRIPKRRMIAAAAISQATTTEGALVEAMAEAEAASADCERRLYNKLLGISTERRTEEETSMKERERGAA